MVPVRERAAAADRRGCSGDRRRGVRSRRWPR
jgi:hypothetical protein